MHVPVRGTFDTWYVSIEMRDEDAGCCQLPSLMSMSR